MKKQLKMHLNRQKVENKYFQQLIVTGSVILDQRNKTAVHSAGGKLEEKQMTTW